MANPTAVPPADVSRPGGLPPHRDHEVLLQPPRERSTGPRVVSAVILAFVALALWSVAANERFEWGLAFGWFLSRKLVVGLGHTLELTVVAMLIGVVLGVLLALARLSSIPVLSAVSGFFIWFFRGVPVYVQLLFWGFIAAVYPRIGIGIPGDGPSLFSLDANQVITPFLAAVLGLGLNEAAYMSEIVRAGLLSVPPGQAEAAQSLGMRSRTTFWRVVLPQAMKVIIPPTGNQTISMLKTTSLVSVLAFPELLYSAQLVYSENFKTIPLLLAASAWYLVVTSVLFVGQMAIERRYGRGYRRTSTARTRRWRRASAPPSPTTITGVPS